ncbi:MAG: MerR family transcriptional regulator [Anaerolineae bacterium]|nr:MerR family transcriptional regulator [Anaerolineae bacterium]
MQTVAELSDEPKYTIKSVFSQTGIRPVTIRAWERRHEVLNPHRSENHYRLYSDQEVAILRWLKNRVENGISISSAVSELRSMIRNGIWPEAIPTLVMPAEKKPAIPAEQIAQQLYDALVATNEDKASDLLRDANHMYDLIEFFQKIIIPTLAKIGESRYFGRISISTEHFANSYLHGKLLSIMQTLPSRRIAQHILIGCAPGEQQEIGSLMFATLLREAGFRVEFLGADIYLDDLVDYARLERPDMVILSGVREDSIPDINNMVKNLQKQHPAPLFGYSAKDFSDDTALHKMILGKNLGEALDAALGNVQMLMKGRSHSRNRAKTMAEMIID